MAKTKVQIYFGPPSWFHTQLPEGVKRKNLVTLVLQGDAERRHHTISAQGEAVEREERPRPKHVVAESSDYASINESAITNFVSLIREINPKNLYLNNPPARVCDQIKRAFHETSEISYIYPAFTTHTLRKFHDGYGEKLVGQAAARDSLLAAMYALTRPKRTRPVVLMFYGPSGVGKTQTAQFINSLLGGELLRKQFSMFHSEKFASYMFGGEHGEDSLARDLLERETGVILIDEFDKANPTFHSAFYELFDTGEFVDRNYKVKVGPALIICTSNYASPAEIRESLGDALTSRFDDLIEFENLSPQEVLEVIERVVDDRLADLEEDERTYLDRQDLLDLLKLVAVEEVNIRRLGKYIDAVVSTALVRAVLASPEESDVSPSPASVVSVAGIADVEPRSEAAPQDGQAPGGESTTSPGPSNTATAHDDRPTLNSEQ